MFKLLYMGMLVCLHIIGAIMAFVVLNTLANKINYEGSRVYRFFEKNNFTIYLFHQQIIYIVISLVDGKMLPIAFVICNFVAAIAFSSLIAVALNRWRVTRFLIGQNLPAPDISLLFSDSNQFSLRFR